MPVLTCISATTGLPSLFLRMSGYQHTSLEYCNSNLPHHPSPTTITDIDMLPTPLDSTSSCSSTSTPVRKQRPRARSRAESITANSKDANIFFGVTPPTTPQVMKTPPTTPSIRDVMSLPTLNLDEVGPKDDLVTAAEPEAIIPSMPELKVNSSKEKESLKASPTSQSVPENINSGKVDSRCQCNIM